MSLPDKRTRETGQRSIPGRTVASRWRTSRTVRASFPHLASLRDVGARPHSLLCNHHHVRLRRWTRRHTAMQNCARNHTGHWTSSPTYCETWIRSPRRTVGARSALVSGTRPWRGFALLYHAICASSLGCALSLKKKDSGFVPYG